VDKKLDEFDEARKEFMRVSEAGEVKLSLKQATLASIMKVGNLVEYGLG